MSNNINDDEDTKLSLISSSEKKEQIITKEHANNTNDEIINDSITILSKKDDENDNNNNNNNNDNNQNNNIDSTTNILNNNNNNNNINNDFVIRDNFPALRLENNIGWNIDNIEPIPNYLFWCAPTLLNIIKKKKIIIIDKDNKDDIIENENNNDNNKRDITTQQQQQSSSKINSTQQQQQQNQQLLWNQLLYDCNIIFNARTLNNNASYSIGTTYYLPSQMKPRCILEKLVMLIYNKHTKHIYNKGIIIPEQSGAEWWTLIMDHNDTNNDIKSIDKKNKKNNDDDESNDSNDSKNDDDDDDDVGMHFDADYGLEEQCTNLLLHPRLATVTYLTNIGTPTIIFNQRSPPKDDINKNTLNGSIRNGYLSHPIKGKHISFDGRLLHGAPSSFFPPYNNNNNNNSITNEDDDVKEQSIKKQKIESNETYNETNNETNQNNYNNKIQELQNKRITLLVNIWINHCPLDGEPLDDEIVDELNKSYNNDKDDNDSNSNIEFIFGSEANGDNDDWSGIKPIELPKVSLKAATITDDNDNTNDDIEPAGEEEIVIGGRLVTISYGATMNDFHNASKIAGQTINYSNSSNNNNVENNNYSNNTNGCIELEFDREVISLTVGEEVIEDEDDDEDENDESDNE